jgi:hypothetical protein
MCGQTSPERPSLLPERANDVKDIQKHPPVQALRVTRPCLQLTSEPILSPWRFYVHKLPKPTPPTFLCCLIPEQVTWEHKFRSCAGMQHLYLQPS